MFECVYHGTLWALAIAFISAPFTYFARYGWALAFGVILLLFVVSRVRRRPLGSWFDYSTREFPVALVSASLAVYPLTLAAFAVLFVSFLYIPSFFP